MLLGESDDTVGAASSTEYIFAWFNWISRTKMSAMDVKLSQMDSDKILYRDRGGQGFLMLLLIDC